MADGDDVQVYEMAAAEEGPPDAGDTSIPIADDAPPQEEVAPSAPAEEKKEPEPEPKAEAEPEAVQQVELQALAAVASGDDDSGMVGKFFKFEAGGKVLNLKLQSLSEVPPDDTSDNLMMLTTGTGGGGEVQSRKKTVEEIIEEKKKEKIEYLVPDSTNGWLYVKDSHLADDASTGLKGCLKNCSDNSANMFIAIFVIVIQIAAYIAMTLFLQGSRNGDLQARKETCYGPNCDKESTACMSFGTGGLTSVLLVGFLWADVVNTASLMTKDMRWFLASLLVLAELFTAIVCGFLVGVYSESDFDAIGGAVGILFVHDLDEKVYASMQVFRETGYATLKKIVALSLWIILSVVVALAVSCKYDETEALFGQCLTQEFKCHAGSQCIWEGFVCNGVSDCDDDSDELAGGAACDYSQIKCPGSDATLYDVDCTDEGVTSDGDTCHKDKPSHFMCESDGACIPFEKRCNGVIDCDDGSDEGRAQKCQKVISQIKCDKALNITTLSDGYKQKWTGNFRCNNGQCIDAQYACDGTPDDCVDGSDEYPNFNKAKESPWKVACPYARTMTCTSDEILCKTDGRCIAKTALCDGTKDCTDGLDERNCAYNCKEGVKRQLKFQCSGNIANVNETHIVKWFTGNMTASDTIDNDDSVDWDVLVGDADGACVPISWRCDGASDCDDNTDEELCSLFSCGDDEYQCADSGLCIPKTWLCDDVVDCAGGEDETDSVCQANGVNPNSNGCITNGYFYQCNNYPSYCLYSYQMCDGVGDCPGNDDEDVTVCASAYAAATSTTPAAVEAGGSGSLSCGGTYSSSDAYYNGELSFSFTTPSSGRVLISACFDENEGDGSMRLCKADNIYDCVYGMPSGCGCPGYAMIDADTSYDITANTDYVLMYQTWFSGTYKFEVVCGSSVSGSGTCAQATSSGTTSTFDPYGYYYP